MTPLADWLEIIWLWFRIALMLIAAFYAFSAVVIVVCMAIMSLLGR
jgi:hypothetical protein